MSLANKISHSIEAIKKGESIALKYNKSGYSVAFSGGKDSQVIYELCKLAKVKFTSFYKFTTMDPPELVKFIKQKYPKVSFIKPKLSMYQLIKKVGFLPTAKRRYCCQYLKESSIPNTVVITGVRKVESKKRRLYKEFSTECKVGKDYVQLNPILNWTDQEVWKFIKENIGYYCNLYDEGFGRIGCIGCPLISKKQVIFEFRKYPKYYNIYLNAVKWLIEKKGRYDKFDNAEDVLNWWISHESLKTHLAGKLQLNLFNN